jgi:hypothetical protein
MTIRVARGMLNRAESHLERQLLPGVAIEIEAEGITPSSRKVSGDETPASGFTVSAITVAPSDPPKR